MFLWSLSNLKERFFSKLNKEQKMTVFIWIMLGGFLLALLVLKSIRVEKKRQKNEEESGFKILVPKKEGGEEFNFNDLMKEADVFHGKCYKGKAELRQEKGEYALYWRLICRRCRITEMFGAPGSFEGRLKIAAATEKVIKTAIDGETRRLGMTSPGTALYVAQKT